MEYTDKSGSKVIVVGDTIIRDGQRVKKQPIGFNYINGIHLGGYLSSFGGIFTDEKISIESGIGDCIRTKIGDIQDAYGLLKEKIKAKDTIDINEISSVVLETVNEYFGGIENISSRLNYYTPEDEDTSINNKISNLKHSGAAMCVERSALTQNLLCSLGIKSVYKSSGIMRNGNSEVHSYNLIEFEDHYYIFDTSIPNVVGDKISPLIAEIDKNSFDLISCPLADTGISITVSHYNPYRQCDVTITYDSGREKHIDVIPLDDKRDKSV